MVGTRYIDFFDENRDEVLGKRNGKRRIAIRFYYPGVETEGAVFCDGLTPRKKKWYGRKPDQCCVFWPVSTMIPKNI